MLTNARLPRCLFGKIPLGQEMLVHTWEEPEIYQIRTVNQAYQNDWPKETWKKYPIKIIQTTIRMLLSNSLPESDCMSIHTYCILFFLLRNTLLASLISILVEILFCKAKGPGPLSLTTGLVARMRCRHHCELASISSWEPKPQDQRYIISRHLAGEMLTTCQRPLG